MRLLTRVLLPCLFVIGSLSHGLRAQGLPVIPPHHDTVNPACSEALAKAEQALAKNDSPTAIAAAMVAEQADPDCAAVKLLFARIELAEAKIDEALARLAALADEGARLPPYQVRRAQVEAALLASDVLARTGEAEESLFRRLQMLRLDPLDLHGVWRGARWGMLGSNPENEALLSSAGGHLMRHLRAYLKLGSSSVPSNFFAPVEPRQEKVEFTGTYSTKPPLVSPRPDVDKQVKPTEHVSALVSGASADTIWCFLRDKPEAVVLARDAKRRRRVPHAAPIPVSHGVALGEHMLLAHAQRAELTLLDKDGKVERAWPIARPATHLDVCPSTRLAFYVGDGLLWSLDLETGENRATGEPADWVTVNALDHIVTVHAAALDLAGLRQEPLFAHRQKQFLLGRDGLQSASGTASRFWYSPWGLLMPHYAEFLPSTRVVGVASDPTRRSVPAIYWQNRASPSRTTRSPLTGFMRVRSMTSSFAHNSPAWVTATRVAIHSRQREDAPNGGFAGHYGWLSCWSRDGLLFATTRDPLGQARDAGDLGAGVAAFELKPKFFDVDYGKSAEKLRARLQQTDPAQLEARRAEWANRLKLPAAAAGLARLAPETDAARARARLAAAWAGAPVPPRPSWADLAPARAVKPEHRLEALRLLGQPDPLEIGPLLHRARRLAKDTPDFPPARAALGLLLAEIGDLGAARADLEAVVAADAGASDLTHTALIGLARLHARGRAEAASVGCLAASAEIDPAHAPTREAARRLGVSLPGPRTHPADLRLEPAPAAPPADRLALACQSVVMVRSQPEGTPMLGVLVSSSGHILVPLRSVKPHYDQVLVSFMVAKQGQVEQLAQLPGRMVRFDGARQIALVLAEGVPEGCRPASLAPGEPAVNDEVHLFSQPRADSLIPECSLQAGVVDQIGNRLNNAAMFTHTARAPQMVTYHGRHGDMSGFWVKGSAILFGKTGEMIGFAAPSSQYPLDQSAYSSPWLRQWLLTPGLD